MSNSSETQILGKKEISLLLTSTLIVMSSTTIAPALPEIAKEFPNEEAWVIQLVLTIAALFTGLASFIVGNLLDKFGRRKILTTAIFFYSITGSAGLYLEDIRFLLLSRALFGITVAGVMISTVTLIGDYYEGEQRSKMVGLQSSFMTFGGVLWIFFGGYLAEISWHAPFAIYLLGFVMLFLCLNFIEEPTVEKREKIDQKIKSHDESLSEHGLILLFAYTLGFLMALTFYFLVVFLPFFLESEFGSTPSEIGIVMALHNLVAGISALQYKRLISKCNFWLVFTLSYFSMGLGMIIISFSSTYQMTMTGIMVFGIGSGWLLPNINNWLFGKIHQPIRGRAVGGLTFALFFGQFMSPILGNLLSGGGDIRQLYLIAASYVLVLGIIFQIKNYLRLRSLNTEK